MEAHKPAENGSTGVFDIEAFQAMFTDDCVFHPTRENYIMIAAFGLIFCLSVVGNSLVVLVILQQKSMRSVTNLYLLNLALSDLLLSVVCMPPTLVSSLVYCWVFGEMLCRLLAYLQPVVVTASAYTLAAIALERYYAICQPLHSRVWHTRSHATFVIGLVWLISIIANFLMLFMYETRTYNRNGINCAPKHSPGVHFAYQIYMTIVLLVVPLILMTLLYGSVIRTLRSGIKVDIAAIGPSRTGSGYRCSYTGKSPDPQSRNGALRASDPLQHKKHSDAAIHYRRGVVGRIMRDRFPTTISACSSPAPEYAEQRDPQSTSDSNDRLRNATATMSTPLMEQSVRSTTSGKVAVAKQRLVRMLIVVVIIFFCCWTPSYIWWLILNAQDWGGFGKFNVWNSEINTLITVLTYISSCTNPITYCFLNSKFRNALFTSFGCKVVNSSMITTVVRPQTHCRYARQALLNRLSDPAQPAAITLLSPNDGNNNYNNTAVCTTTHNNVVVIANMGPSVEERHDEELPLQNGIAGGNTTPSSLKSGTTTPTSDTADPIKTTDKPSSFREEALAGKWKKEQKECEIHFTKGSI